VAGSPLTGLQTPFWIGQCEGSAQVVLRSGSHVQYGKYGVGLHASPVTEQFWLRVGQSVLMEHDWGDALQVPPTGGQPVSSKQLVGALVHVPGSVGHSSGSGPGL
jgi:hypothetical protein